MLGGVVTCLDGAESLHVFVLLGGIFCGVVVGDSVLPVADRVLVLLEH